MLSERECKTCGETFRTENGRECWHCRMKRERTWVVKVEHSGTDVLVLAYRPNESRHHPTRELIKRVRRPTERRIEKAKRKAQKWCDRANRATELARGPQR